MQAALVRTLFLLGLALLLVGDFSSILSRISSALAVQRHQTAPHKTPETSPAEDSDRIFSTANKKEKLAQLTSTMKNSCLPKLICELNASPEKDKLTQKAKSLLQLIRDTSMSMTAEVSSRYHFAAHMGQLISGIDGTGCHNFYPGCPLPTLKVLNLINKPSLY